MFYASDIQNSDMEFERLQRITYGPYLPATARAGDVHLQQTLGQWFEYETVFLPGNIWAKAGIGVNDTFDRADSATTLASAETGQPWLPTTGTWGTNTNEAYSASDTTSDLVLIETYTGNPTAQMVTRGTLNSAVNFRGLQLVVRALDVNNFIQVDLFNGNIRAFKNDAGVFTSLGTAATTTADNTNYTLTTICRDTTLKAYVDGVLKITYTLAAGEQKYSGYTKCGIKLNKGGAPATAARANNFYVRQAA